jgi:hypothetical protein
MPVNGSAKARILAGSPTGASTAWRKPPKMRSKMPCAAAGPSEANIITPVANTPADTRNIALLNAFSPRAAIASPCHCWCFAEVPRSGMIQRPGARKVARPCHFIGCRAASCALALKNKNGRATT